MNVGEMDPQEAVRGLMRGDRESLKLGYTAENAARAVIGLHPGMTRAERWEVRRYAEGFAAGMAEDAARAYPTAVSA